MAEDKQTEPEPVWCIVANIVHEHGYGPGGAEIRRGAKHFPPGAKMYILSFFWGMGGDEVTVLGRHRHSHRYFMIVLKSKLLANWRLELVYSPYVIEQIQKYGEYNHDAPGQDAAKRRAEEILARSPASDTPTQPFVTRPPTPSAERTIEQQTE